MGKKIACLMAILSVLPLLEGCSGSVVKPYHPLPQSLENKVQMPGFKGIRAWGDKPSKILQESADKSLQEEMAYNHGHLQPVLNAVALSGGGGDGAFGAGLLCGWTKSGTRPQFKLVTGISTGALMAPFVFLGPAYDPQLKAVYTTISDKNIYQPYSMFSIFLSLINLRDLPSMADDQPMINTIAKQIDLAILKKIAAEHRKGRRLLIGTSQFNAQRLVIWDMGAIANSGSPKALALFRKIMAASASLPVSFPPQFFDVEAGEKRFQEMHVDGGIEAQVMLFENALAPFSSDKTSAENRARERRLYIVRNQKIQPEWRNIQPSIKSIAVRAISSLTKSQGIGDLFRIYTYTRNTGLDYNLAFIPESFTMKAKTEFDPAYMNNLFQTGFNLGKSGYPWRKYPPEFTPREVALGEVTG